jgi:hypothetical protein
MVKKILPVVTKAELENAGDDAWDFLFLFIDKYYDLMQTGDVSEIAGFFYLKQQTLILFNNLYGQVVNGGFLQLIFNGHSYILNKAFSNNIRLWGAEKLAATVDKAIHFFLLKKDELLKLNTNEDFSNMYKQYPEFESIDNEFYEIMDDETKIIRGYVESNIDAFARIV